MHAIRSQLVVICLLAGLGMIPSAAAQYPMPERGLDKSTVETRLGAPQRIEGPVGEPPITKWVYADFIVVFEYDHVVHTVPRQPVVEQGSVDPAVSPAPSGRTAPAPGTGTGTEGASGAGSAAPASDDSGSAGTTTADPAAEPATPADTKTTGDTLNIPR